MTTALAQFTAQAIARLHRSGVETDETYGFALVTDYPDKNKVSVKPAAAHIRYYVVGDEHTFWVFDRDRLWPDTKGAARATRTFSVEFRESKPTLRGGFYEIDKEQIPNDAYTPVEANYVTAHEADLWLAEHASEVPA